MYVLVLLHEILTTNKVKADNNDFYVLRIDVNVTLLHAPYRPTIKISIFMYLLIVNWHMRHPVFKSKFVLEFI